MKQSIIKKYIKLSIGLFSTLNVAFIMTISVARAMLPGYIFIPLMDYNLPLH